MKNQDILKKIATGDFADGGILSNEQAKKFFSYTVDESVLKNNVRTEFMSSPIMELNKMNVGNRVARPKGEGVAPTSGFVGVETDQVLLSTRSIIVPWKVNYEVYEDNIEKEGFEDSLIRDISAQLANDLEELYIEGDTGSGDPYLALFDGWIKLMAVGGHDVSAAGTLSRTTFSKVLKGLPTKYRRNRAKLRFFCHPDKEQDYRDELAQRNTSLGDTSLEGNANIKIFGIEVVPVPFCPAGYLILTHYQNLIVGIHSKIRLEKDKDIYAGQHLYAIHLRTGCAIENTDAISYTNDVT